MSRTPSTKPRRTALQIFDALSPRKRSALWANNVRRVLELLERQPLDGYGVRILPCDYAEQVLSLPCSRIRTFISEAQRLGCVTAIFVISADSIADPSECFIVAADGRQPDVFWHAATLLGDLRAARERCFAPSTPTPEVAAA
jgi:hypothetical protein